MVDDLCTVVRYDQRGSGRSNGRGPEFAASYTLEAFIADLDALRVQFGFEQWVVGGHSSGTALALVYAAKFPQHTVALVYLSGTGIDPGWREVYHRNRLASLSDEERAEYIHLRAQRDTLSGQGRENVQRRLRILSARTDVADVIYEEYLPRFTEYSINDEVNEYLGAELSHCIQSVDFLATIQTMDIPSLIIHGEADPRPVSSVLALANHLPNARFFLLPNAGHFPWIEQHCGFRTVLRSFLEDVEGHSHAARVSRDRAPDISRHDTLG